MIAAIYSFIAMGSIRGLEFWVLLWVACPVLYFVLFSLFPNNRTKSGKLHLFLSFVVAEIVLDIIFGAYLFRYPAFLEYGLGITYGLILFSIFLGINGVLSTIWRYKDSKTNENQE